MSEVEDMIKALDAGMTNITGINGKLREENEQLKNRIEFLKEMMQNAIDSIDADDALGAYDWLAKGMFVPSKEDK